LRERIATEIFCPTKSMTDPVDFCKYFADIEANPAAKAPRLTIRQFLQAKEHLYTCDPCFNRTERVIAKAPKEIFPQRGIN
jgi:hypothetical protein